MFRIGVDVGGTYTDLVATDETGQTIFAKSPSTPADQSIGVMAGLEELARRLKVTRTEMLATTDRLVHGTTVATNALLERKGAKVALLTTEGHRDIIEMREGLKPDRYDLRSPPPEPLVPRERRFGVRERLKASGEVVTPLDAGSLGEAIAAVRKSGATSVAVLPRPAGGISGSRRCADLLKIPDLVPFDMGGTSTDISLIADGQVSLSADGMLAGQRIALRSLDIASIAAGGGSIASVDSSGTLRVGPGSAGSGPGPAPFGHGGTAATVTHPHRV